MKQLNKRPQIITTDLSVGITPDINRALQKYCAATGIRPSQYGRLAILQSLMRDGLLPPMQPYTNNDAS